MLCASYCNKNVKPNPKTKLKCLKSKILYSVNKGEGGVRQSWALDRLRPFLPFFPAYLSGCPVPGTGKTLGYSDQQDSRSSCPGEGTYPLLTIHAHLKMGIRRHRPPTLCEQVGMDYRGQNLFVGIKISQFHPMGDRYTEQYLNSGDLPPQEQGLSRAPALPASQHLVREQEREGSRMSPSSRTNGV